jgi:hypothetical protein
MRKYYLGGKIKQDVVGYCVARMGDEKCIQTCGWEA